MNLFLLCSVTKLYPTLGDPMTKAHPAPLSLTVSWSLLIFASIASVMLSNHLLCNFLLLLPSVFLFQSVGVHIKWPKYWHFSFSISSSNEYPRLASCRIDWFELPVVRGTLKSLLQHCNSKASVLWHSAFFMVQFSHFHEWSHIMLFYGHSPISLDPPK